MDDSTTAVLTTPQQTIPAQVMVASDVPIPSSQTNATRSTDSNLADTGIMPYTNPRARLPDPGQTEDLADGVSLPQIQAPVTPQPISQPAVSVGNRERGEFASLAPELTPLVELKEDHELEPEVEGWLEKLEKGEDIQLPQPVTDDQGQVVMADTGAVVTEEKVVMPLTVVEMDSGMKQSVNSSARWLSEWVKRIMKQMGDKAAFRQSQ
jgi:hypothetical protein